jgi:putative transposase
VPEQAREIGVSDATIYTWKSKYGGMEVSEAQKLKELEDETRRLKHLVADLSPDKEVLKAVIRKLVSQSDGRSGEDHGLAR